MMKWSLIGVPIPIFLALWLWTGFGEIDIGIDQNSFDFGISLVDGSAIFHINYYGSFDSGPIEPYFISESNRTFTAVDGRLVEIEGSGFRFQSLLDGFFYIGWHHPAYEPGFALSVPFWLLVSIALTLPVIWHINSLPSRQSE